MGAYMFECWGLLPFWTNVDQNVGLFIRDPLKGRDALCHKFLGGLAPGIIHPSSNIESLTIVTCLFTIEVKIYLQKKF